MSVIYLLQTQSPGDVPKNNCSEKFCKAQWKTPVLEPGFS